MDWDPHYQPRLRPLQAVRLSEQNDDEIAVGDPCGLSDVLLTMPTVALPILAMMDGNHTCAQIREKYFHTTGQPVAREAVCSLLDYLERAHFLEGPAFEAHYRALLEKYRARPARELLEGSALANLEKSGALFEELLAAEVPAELPGEVAGLVAPHLDYPRGRPCYARAYATLRHRSRPHRVVILGTNHFPRTGGVVATGSHFVTPLGLTRTDRDFLDRLERLCGDLRACELDHRREHSVELQVAWLQHLFGPDQFQIVPILCPDPCGPTGVGSPDDDGVGLRDFADALGQLVAERDEDTLIVAGADLSHVGAGFGDERTLDEGFLEEVRARDERALAELVEDGPDGWVQFLAEDDNPTRVCSAGCIYALARALPDASPTLLGYHQAVDPRTQEGVTCAAMAFT